MFYTLGDTPAAPLLVLPARLGEPLDLELYGSVEAQLVQPDGTVTPTAAQLLGADDVDGPGVEVTLPKLEQAGLVVVSLQLSTLDGRQDTVDVEPIVVEARDGWHTLSTARAEWDGAQHITDVRLYRLLRAARAACVAFKPAAGTRRPLETEVEAQLLQARNRSAAARIDPASGDDGTGSYGATIYPMDWAVKALLRPARRLGAIR